MAEDGEAGPDPRGRSATVVSVELLFDETTEARIRGEWDRLAGAGLSSAGLHPGPTNRPHVSLAVRTRLGDLDDLRAAPGMLPLPLTLGGLLLFVHGTRTVLARAVVPVAGLLELHAGISAALDARAWGDALPHTAPDQWTPHVTLSRRLRSADLPRALAHVDGAPISTAGTALRVWDGAERVVHPLG